MAASIVIKRVQIAADLHFQLPETRTTLLQWKNMFMLREKLPGQQLET